MQTCLLAPGAFAGHARGAAAWFPSCAGETLVGVLQLQLPEVLPVPPCSCHIGSQGQHIMASQHLIIPSVTLLLYRIPYHRLLSNKATAPEKKASMCCVSHQVVACACTSAMQTCSHAQLLTSEPLTPGQLHRELRHQQMPAPPHQPWWPCPACHQHGHVMPGPNASTDQG